MPYPKKNGHDWSRALHSIYAINTGSPFNGIYTHLDPMEISEITTPT